MDYQAEPVDTQMGDAEILEAFKAMGPLLMQDKYQRDTKEEKDPKKHKRDHHQEPPAGTPDVAKLVRLMGNIPLRLDSDQPTDEKARLFRLLSSNSRPSFVASLDDESEGVACADETEDPGHRGTAAIHPIAYGSLSGPDEHVGGQSAQAVEGWSGGRTVADSSASWSHHSGRRLPLSTMESDAEDVGPNEERSHHDEQDDQVHGAAQTDLQRSECHPEISCVETGGKPTDSSLDPSDGHETRRTPILAGDITGVDGMGAHWCNNEASLTDAEQAMSGATTNVGEGKGQTERAPWVKPKGQGKQTRPR